MVKLMQGYNVGVLSGSVSPKLSDVESYNKKSGSGLSGHYQWDQYKVGKQYAYVFNRVQAKLNQQKQRKEMVQAKSSK